MCTLSAIYLLALHKARQISKRSEKEMVPTENIKLTYYGHV